MAQNLQQIINTSENEIKQMKAREIENLLNELKPFIIDYHEEDWNHPKELWSKVNPEEENNMVIGDLNPSFVEFCNKIFKRVISLAQSVKSEGEIEFPIIERLLMRLSTAYASRVLNEEIANRARQFLKTGSKKDLKQVKDELVKFISSTNVYDQEKQDEAKFMLAKLENYSLQNNNVQFSRFFRPGIIIPLVFILVLVVFVVTIVRRRGEQK